MSLNTDLYKLIEHTFIPGDTQINCFAIIVWITIMSQFSN